MTKQEIARLKELNEKIDRFLDGDRSAMTSAEMVERAKLNHKRQMQSNPIYLEQMAFEKRHNF